MPDHPTASPREPTMADAIRWFSDIVADYEDNVDLISPADVDDILVRLAHYRNALAAMRAVDVLTDPERTYYVCVQRQPDGAFVYVGRGAPDLIDKLDAAFPTPTESTDAK